MAREDLSDPFSFGGFIEEQARREKAELTKNEQGELANAERAWREAHLPPKINRLVEAAEAKRFADEEAVARVARRDAAQRQLAISEWKKCQDTQLNRQKTLCVLDGVVRRIREGLREAGVGVSEVQPNEEVVVPARHFHVDFALDELGDVDWMRVLADKFLKKILEENPNRVHMFCYRLELPACVEATGHYECEGLIMRAVCDYHLPTDQRVVRLDLMHSNADEEHTRLLTGPGAGIEWRA